MRKNKRTLYLTQGAVTAALYVVFTYLAAAIGLSSGVIQVRFSEALCILPIFTPAAIPGLFAGCLLANALTGAVVWDVVFGSLATLAGALGTRLLRKQPFAALWPPVLSNMIVVPLVLIHAYHVGDAWWYLVLTVGAGEVISCVILGGLLYKVLKKTEKYVFPENLLPRDNKRRTENRKSQRESGSAFSDTVPSDSVSSDSFPSGSAFTGSTPSGCAFSGNDLTGNNSAARAASDDALSGNTDKPIDERFMIPLEEVLGDILVFDYHYENAGEVFSLTADLGADDPADRSLVIRQKSREAVRKRDKDVVRKQNEGTVRDQDKNAAGTQDKGTDGQEISLSPDDELVTLISKVVKNSGLLRINGWKVKHSREDNQGPESDRNWVRNGQKKDKEISSESFHTYLEFDSGEVMEAFFNEGDKPEGFDSIHRILKAFLARL
ncbi:MAG: QueT transporter family protein [Lachnospiraceae bacterium]|nr:QueT transporter family protein [Lachnospiraceae bacterium]